MNTLLQLLLLLRGGAGAWPPGLTRGTHAIPTLNCPHTTHAPPLRACLPTHNTRPTLKLPTHNMPPPLHACLLSGAEPEVVAGSKGKQVAAGGEPAAKKHKK